MTSSEPQASPPQIIAIVPQRLAIAAEGLDPRPAMQIAHVAEAAHIASDWQSLGVQAEFFEMGATTHGVQRDRMGEVIGLVAAAGEQLALARAAFLECALWRAARERRDDSGDEMCHRAMAEQLSYFCLATGHSLANISVRLLALDGRLHPQLIDEFETVFQPLSEERRDWLACDSGCVRRLRRVARHAADVELREVPTSVTSLIAAPAWHALDARRGADFHRRRPQSDGILGVPLRSLWKRTEGGAMMLSGGRDRYEDGLRLADATTAIGESALAALVAAMTGLRAVQATVTANICQGRLRVG